MIHIADMTVEDISEILDIEYYSGSDPVIVNGEHLMVVDLRLNEKYKDLPAKGFRLKYYGKDDKTGRVYLRSGTLIGMLKDRKKDIKKNSP